MAKQKRYCFDKVNTSLFTDTFQDDTLDKILDFVQKEEDRNTISETCRVLESTAMEIFAKYG